ncbi:AcvB/VirJ family lysyl-phosphatidylglycerol hydrolase [Soonwooa sp.]|uniref:AcvB/VirJ family lysyl-phosphatidylglycerol hydrolase n=1 Tax=Soonwooa sp. TaxID=1938592 RepID=UPI00261505A5|nr:AcvB/VirJ family lysyl-phosphatidylglycerol hydrolase [Soonwooa sp.]
MKKKLLIAGLGLAVICGGLYEYWQYKITKDFPVTSWNSESKKPIIMYISGDAGFNTFSKSLSEHLHEAGYDVFALNSKAYFWNKKTPTQAASEVERYINHQLDGRDNQHVILMGFSFGADVTPFIYNRFSDQMKKNIEKIIVIGPSQSNDFEIHLSEYVGVTKKRHFLVIPEINKITDKPILLIMSDLEYMYFPFKKIKLGNNYKMLHIHGDHQYDNNTKMLADTLVSQFPTS